MSDTPKPKEKSYTNGEITVVWKPDVCIHSTICWKGLYNVFQPKSRPWVKMDGASSERIRAQVDKCPSGALTWYNNADGQAMEIDRETIVEVSQNGPLLVYGNVSIKHPDGSEEKKNKVTALCRCGASGNKPYCDGSHKKVDFQG